MHIVIVPAIVAVGIIFKVDFTELESTEIEFGEGHDFFLCHLDVAGLDSIWMVVLGLVRFMKGIKDRVHFQRAR